MGEERGGGETRHNEGDWQSGLGELSAAEAAATRLSPSICPAKSPVLSAHQPQDLQCSRRREEKMLDAVPDFGRDFGPACGTVLDSLLL